MDDVIEILEKDHRVIEGMVKKIHQVFPMCPVDPEDLKMLEQVLLNHISREDAEIYIPLKKLVKMTPEAEKFLLRSRQDLESIKILALVFFEKYKGENSAALSAGFDKDFLRLTGKIHERVMFEDRELFPFLRDLWSKFFKNQ